MTDGASRQQLGLLALGRAASEGAKQVLGWRLKTRLLVLAVGCAALFVPQSWAEVIYVLSVVALVLEVVVWILSQWGHEKHVLGEQARRHAMVASAFGESPEPVEERELRSKFSKSDERRAAILDDPHYYASDTEAGLPRLSELLQESAFFSKHLYKKAASRACVLVAVLLGGVAVAALIALPTTAGDTSLLIARLVVVVLGVFIGIDVLGRARSWDGAAREVEAVYRRLGATGARRSSKVLMGILADYSVTTADCPPIPTDIHEREREGLDRLWAQSRPGGNQP